MSVKTPSPGSSIASLETVDFSRLLDKDQLNSASCWSCQPRMVSFISTSRPTYQEILQDEAVMQMMESEKEKDNRGTHTHGYKPPGSRDCYETLKRSELFESFIGLSHFVNKTLIMSLSDILHLEGGARFEEHHRNDRLSNTTLVLLHYPPQNLDDGMGHNKHTDIGSITLLFTKQWGLQLQQLGSMEWLFVEPRDGHAIINIGDSLRFLSGKRFNSCLHRVIPVASDENRGQEDQAEEWHDQKYVMFGESHEKQAMSSMLTGGMERAIEIKA
ncbi:2OG-Fe-II oxygenase family oxidoreductase [Pholiota molesta]|nr:2OG-Fe-II oxygenase family oxidoreductase [Pholiota molesta]